MHKYFDRDLFNSNDATAKSKAIEIFAQFPKLKVLENVKKRGVDLQVYQDDKIVFNIEVSRKTAWKSSTFPYENLNVETRKEKYCILEQPTIFMVFSEDWSQYLTALGNDILLAPKEEVHNKYIRCGEYFFKLPISQVYFNDVKPLLEKLGVQL